jgi:hypothetical protein
MKEDRTGGASGAKTSNIAASDAPGRERLTCHGIFP